MQRCEEPVDDRAPGEPVRSRFAGDPEYRELLEWFVESLAELSGTMRDQMRSADYAGLQVHAHQVKGAAGGYGFPELTTLAAELERACRTGDPVSIATELDRTLAYIARVSL
jgi:HPt (histidine-containing phosphotransfer) domain-containing protein